MSDCIVNVTGGELPAKEIEAYKKRAVEKFGEMPRQIDIKVDGEEVELQYHLASEHFDRIRRITGYLVGTLDRSDSREDFLCDYRELPSPVRALRVRLVVTSHPPGVEPGVIDFTAFG